MLPCLTLRVILSRWLALLMAFALFAPAKAHPVPFSYLDIHLRAHGIDGTLAVHVFDAGRELAVSPPERLLDPAVLAPRAGRLAARLAPRMTLIAGHRIAPQWIAIAPDPARNSVRLAFQVSGGRPGALTIGTDLFPYDPQHQTFVNIYEGDTLKRQWIFAKGSPPRTYFLGTAAGAAAVMQTFVPAGIHHILIGPDHLLFLIGLLLLGGSWRTLVKIVTAFTLGHSLTLSLAALDIVSPPPSLTEPAIALTIVLVGVDNLVRGSGRDLRAWMALLFGLVHGFGFATVLREFGLPREALLLSLFSFNVGVELGQLSVVIVVASVLDFVRRQSQIAGKRVGVAGSAVVIAAGGFWFIQRVFFPGGA